MKSLKITTALLLFFSSIFFTNCSPDHDFTSTTKEIITSGAWKIASFQKGQEATSEYGIYQFAFKPDGTVSGTKNSEAFTGTWRVIRDNEFDILQLQLNGSDAALLQLSHQWNVLDKNTGALRMQYDGHQSEQLVLTKF